MSLDVNGINVGQSGTALSFTNTLGKTWNVSSGGIVTKPSQVYFTAAGTTGYVNMTTSGWYKIILQSVVNIGGTAYDITNSRFTAPVDGIYFFTGTSYLTNTSNNAAVYYHPMFFVNGSGAGRAPYTTMYRMRHYGFAASSYDDGMVTQIYYLLAGDYVEYYHYFNNPDTGYAQYYDYYTRFSGILIG